MKTVVWGLGKLGSEAVEAGLRAPDVELVGAVSRRARSMGLSLPGGVPIFDDLDAVAEAYPGAAVVHAHHELGDALVAAAVACASRGLSFVTSSGLFDPAGQLHDQGRDMDRIAREHGVHIVAAGAQPGFFFDVLPGLVLPIAAVWDRATAAKPSDASSWPKDTRHALGIGEPPETLDGDLPYPLRASAHLLADALGLGIEQITEQRVSTTSDRDIELHDEVLPSGVATGFSQVCRIATTDSREIELRWEVSVDDELVRGERPFRLRVERSSSSILELALDGEFSDDPYPATVARMLHVMAAAQNLSPGLHRVVDVGLSRSVAAG